MTRAQFGDAYNTGLNRTIAFLLSRGVPRDAVADVAQTAWMRGWERLQQLRDDRMILPWIGTIALNQYRQIARARSLEEVWKPAHGDLLTTALNWAAIDIAGILRSCPPADRQLLAAQMSGATAEELAEQNGVSASAMRVRMYRARKRARQSVPVRPLLAAA